MTSASEGTHPGTSAPEKDCGCGCAGAGDCNDAAAPVDNGRRRLIVGGATVAVVATLANRRAFGGAVCGPISKAGSLNPSQSTANAVCGGLSATYWKGHVLAVTAALGGNSPSLVKLGTMLSALSLVDVSSANCTFQQAFCGSSSNAAHWAAAILNASTAAWNPQYGYTLTSLNAAILSAYNSGKGATVTTILTALEKLETDSTIANVSFPWNVSQGCC